MSLALILFIASGLGLLAVIGLKAVQERFEILLFWPDFRNIVEKNLRMKADDLLDRLDRFSRKNVFTVVHFILFQFRRLIVWMKTKLDEKLYRLMNLIRGRRKIEIRAPASRFLSDISHFRDRARRGH